MTETILVTGGAGYIGGVVAEQLLQKGYRVVIYDNFSTGRIDNIPIHDDVKLIAADLADTKLLDLVFQENRIDAVMHLAASIEVAESMQNPLKYFENNVTNTLNLLEAMLDHNVKRLIFSSSAAVYGTPFELLVKPIREFRPCRPKNPYGQSKLIIEQILSWFHQIHGLSWASLRYFNVAGSVSQHRDRNLSHLIPSVLEVAAGRTSHVQIYGTDYSTPDGSCIRDYVHVQDIAQGHLLALPQLKNYTRLVYNLGSDVGFSVKDVIRVARDITRHSIPVIENESRPGDPGVLIANSSRIRKDLGWKPDYPDLKQIIQTAWHALL